MNGMRQLYLPMRIWDLPIRLFHWSLVALIATSWLSAELLWMRVHVWSGFTIMTLLLFRIIWGLIGSDTARFTWFLKSPVEALRHLAHLTRREPDIEAGHNAAGGWMVLGMLGILSIQVGSGLGSNDDIMTEGPFATMVGKERSDWLTHVHHLNFKMIMVVVLLHVLAIIAYRVLKGHNLVLPMITGKKRLPGTMRAPRMVHPAAGLVVLLFSAMTVFLVVRFVP